MVKASKGATASLSQRFRRSSVALDGSTAFRREHHHHRRGSAGKIRVTIPASMSSGLTNADADSPTRSRGDHRVWALSNRRHFDDQSADGRMNYGASSVWRNTTAIVVGCVGGDVALARRVGESRAVQANSQDCRATATLMALAPWDATATDDDREDARPCTPAERRTARIGPCPARSAATRVDCDLASGRSGTDRAARGGPTWNPASARKRGERSAKKEPLPDRMCPPILGEPWIRALGESTDLVRALAGVPARCAGHHAAMGEGVVTLYQRWIDLSSNNPRRPLEQARPRGARRHLQRRPRA